MSMGKFKQAADDLDEELSSAVSNLYDCDTDTLQWSINRAIEAIEDCQRVVEDLRAEISEYPDYSIGVYRIINVTPDQIEEVILESKETTTEE